MARPVRIEWPEKARIAVVLQVPFEQYERGGVHAGKIHLKDLVVIPTLPEEVTAQVIGAVAHATIYGHPFGAWAYDQVIRYAKGFSHVWFATRCEIAQWYLDHYA